MKKSCGVSLLVWLALIGAYSWVAYKKIGQKGPALAIGVLGGSFAGMLVGATSALFTGGTERDALKRAIAGTEPKDGRLEAASGRIYALGTPLEAPFTGRKCVAYDYDVKNPSAGKSDYAGCALTPCAVDSPRGPVKVLGWAMLDEFPKALQGEMDEKRVLSYLRSTQFEMFGLTNALSYVSNLLTDQDGSIRKDLRISHGEPDLEGRHLEERVVPEGSTVTIIGRWSEAQRGFAPASSAQMNRLFPVSPKSVVQDVRGGALKTFFIALGFNVILHAILVTIYLHAPGK